MKSGKPRIALVLGDPAGIGPELDTRHVGDAVAYMASLPLDTNVPFLTVMAATLPFIGRG